MNAQTSTSVVREHDSVLAITFDAAGTLIRVRGSVGVGYAACLKKLGIQIPTPMLDAAFRKAWKTIPVSEPTFVPLPDDGRSRWRSITNFVLRECGCDSPDMENRFFELAYEWFAASAAWELYPETIDALDALGSSHRLAVLSNFDGRLRGILAGLGILNRFEFVAVSTEIGAEKPHPILWETAARQFGIEPRHILHVGDEPEADWAGAERAGTRSFKLDRSTTDLTRLLTLPELQQA